MNTFTPTEPSIHEPVPAREGRDPGEAPSRLRLLATSAAIAGLTATGGLAVILSTSATGGGGATAMSGTGNGAPQPTSVTNAGTGPTTPTATATPATGTQTTPNATTAPNTGTPTTPQQGGFGPGQFGGQPPQAAPGGGPGHATTGGSN